MIIDNTIGIVQPYMPNARGIESPTLLLRARPTGSGLLTVFHRIFEGLWARSNEPA